MHLKTVDPGDYDWGEAPVAIVKQSSRGIIGSDLDSLIKRASNDLIMQAKNLEHRPDEELVHLFAVGDTPFYGCNRNFDGFDTETCKNRHHTFVKHAKWYRQHKNNDPKLSYGIVKASSFNEKMHRIELICALNRSKSAADRTDGLIADLELQDLASGRDIPVSMSCVLPFDYCSGCNHGARSRKEYCKSAEDGGSCHYGGLWRNIGKVAEDGHQLHANNPGCTFFDISRVRRGADRIAQVLGVVKSASVYIPHRILPNQLNHDALQSLVSCTHTLKSAEVALDLAAADARGFSESYARAFDRRGKVKTASHVEGHRIQDHLRALADANTLLPIQEFFELVAGQSLSDSVVRKVAAAAELLPNLYGGDAIVYDLIMDEEDNPYIPVSSGYAPEVRKWAEDKKKSYCLENAAIKQRAQTQAIRSVEAPLKKKASFDTQISEDTEKLLRHYAMYQLAFCVDRRNQGLDPVAVVAMNSVS